MPSLYIFAGPNGSGKTTAAYTILPEVLGVVEFVNADEIARGLSPFNAEGVAFEAGRIMLQRIEHLMSQEVDFAIETTLSTRSYVHTIRRAQKVGYSIMLYYLWIPSADMSKERVAIRVSRGGHNIPSDVIERRYGRSLFNLANLYRPICNHFAIFNNAGIIPEMVATGGIGIDTSVLNRYIWKIILAHESNSSKSNTDQ